MVAEVVIRTIDLSCGFGSATVLKKVNLEIHKNEIFGIIGPANSGKTTFLRALNRLNYLNARLSAERRDFSGRAKYPKPER